MIKYQNGIRENYSNLVPEKNPINLKVDVEYMLKWK